MRIYLTILAATTVLFLVSCGTPGNIASLQKRVGENPENAQAHYNLALAYLRRGIEWDGPEDIGTPTIASKRLTKKAKEEFQKAVELDPNLPEPHYWLKVIYNSLGKYEEADKESNKYTELIARERKTPEN